MFAPLYGSVIGRAVNAGKLDIDVVNIRDYAENKHLKCDDYPFGGGAGMVMTPQPIGSAIKAADPEHRAHRIYLSPKGATFRQDKAFGLLGYEHLILLCGHYEGIDQRVEETENSIDVTVLLAESDMGKVIGKQGKIAKALRTLVKASTPRDSKKYNVEIKEKD